MMAGCKAHFIEITRAVVYKFLQNMLRGDSDQSLLLQSLINVFSVCMKKLWVRSWPQRAWRKLWSDCIFNRTAQMSTLIWIFTVHTCNVMGIAVPRSFMSLRLLRLMSVTVYKKKIFHGREIWIEKSDPGTAFYCLTRQCFGYTCSLTNTVETLIV